MSISVSAQLMSTVYLGLKVSEEAKHLIFPHKYSNLCIFN